ncbi:Replication factor C large subunit [Candidatus Norongarragalina meridionalis]|nr:Replication factor C large subunit [Candidatus Norongarragalina meridionalis]
MSELWAQKYAPASVAEVAGNDDAKEAVKRWAFEWKRGKKTPLMIYGKTGIGKTALVRALAKEMGWALVQISDGDDVKKTLEHAKHGANLDGTERMIFIDDVDAAFDKASVFAIASFLREATVPVVLAAEDYWTQKISPLRALCAKVEMKGVNKYAAKAALGRIAEVEGADEPDLGGYSGDLRAAINDMQAGCWGARDRQEDVFKTVGRVFKATSMADALRAGNESELDMDMLTRWLEENIPKEYEDTEEIANAYEWMSRGSVFDARIHRRQDYGLGKYSRALTLGGVAASKNAPYAKWTGYSFPSIVRSLSDSKKSRALLKNAARKVAEKTHVSVSRAKEDLRVLGGAALEKYCGFDEEESAFLAEGKVVKEAKPHAKRKAKA